MPSTLSKRRKVVLQTAPLMQSHHKICATCKKEMSPDGRGVSLTSFIFQDVYCSCADTRHQVTPDPNHSVCSHCEKLVGSADGSMTSFLFQDICCLCEQPQIQTGRQDRQLSARLTEATRTAAQGSNPLKMTMRPDDSALMVQIHAGDIIGNYRIIDLIGYGGMGLVFRCEHLTLNRICAIKCVVPSLVSASSWEMFRNEARIAGALRHSSICQIYDLGLHDNRIPYYAMEYLPGKNLSELLDEFGPLSVGAVVEIFLRLVEGLAHAHSQGIIHRDVKPANIMIETDQDHPLDVKILDFGIAELIQSDARPDLNDTKSDTMNRRKVGVGTPAYMSPEQSAGGVLDMRSDIYNLGCTMFEALTGFKPYAGETRPELELNHATAPIPFMSTSTGFDFPSGIEAIVRRTIAKKPENRYQSVDELARDLKLFLECQPIEYAQEELSEVETLKLAEQGVGKIEESGGVRKKSRLPLAIACSLIAIVAFIAIPVFRRSPAPVHQIPVSKNSSSKQSPEKTTPKKKLTKAQISAILVSLQSAFKAQRFDEVVRLTDLLIDDGSANGHVYVMRGTANAVMERTEVAASELRKGIEMEPSLNTELVSDQLTRCYVDCGQMENALAEVTGNLARNKPTAERLRLQGQILCNLNRVDDAIKSYDKSLRLKEEFWTYLERGASHARLNQHAEAVADYTKAIRLRPTETRVYTKRAESYRALGKEELAKADLEKAEQLGLKDWHDLGPNN